jgi:phage terminase large subunit-like protein
MWNTSCPDWESRIVNGQSLVPELPLFAEEAVLGQRAFKRLRVPDPDGKPRLADVAGPWLFPIVEALFGSYDPATHRRMIQEFFLVIPEKNSKTSSGAAIMVTVLICNRRPEGEYAIIASTKEIADITFRQVSATTRSYQELDKIFQI